MRSTRGVQYLHERDGVRKKSFEGTCDWVVLQSALHCGIASRHLLDSRLLRRSCRAGRSAPCSDVG